MMMETAQDAKTHILDGDALREAFPALPDDARVWTYAANRELSERDVDVTSSRLDAFFRNWTSHGRDVRGASAIIDSQIVVVAAHIPSGDISGCGIDKSVHVVERALNEVGAGVSSSLNVVYRTSAGATEIATRSEFRALSRSRSVNGATAVYDLTVQTVGDLRGGRFVVPAAEAWHGKVFGLSPAPEK